MKSRCSPGCSLLASPASTRSAFLPATIAHGCLTQRQPRALHTTSVIASWSAWRRSVACFCLCFQDGAFGIRLENLLVVKNADTRHNFGNRGYLDFETITFVPFQTKCIDASLLTAPQIAWLDYYHAQCRQCLTPLLQDHPDARAWLDRETRPLAAT